jgi:hypothetical protein
VQILHDFDAGPTADLPRPVEISPTLRSQSCLSFAPTSGVLFPFSVTGIFSLHLPNSVNCKYLLKGPKRPTKQ